MENYKRKIILMVEDMNEEKERRLLIQIFTMLIRHKKKRDEST